MSDAREPRTVLHVRIVSGTGGGPEKTILNSPRHLAGTGYRGLAAYLHPPGDPGFEVIAARAAEKQCPLVALPEAWPIDPRVLWKLARLCRRERVAIWHGHDYKSNLYGVLLRPFLGFRLVTTVHGWVKHTSRTPLYYAIDRWTLPRHRAVIAVSRDLEERCLAAGVPRERLHLVHNAIDTEEFKRRAPHPAGGRLRLGAVGRLSEEKGFLLLVEAVERLVAKGFDVELAIAGEGDQEAALAARVAASPCRERLRLLGFQRDTVALFEGFDVFCLSSLREGLPNVVLEAMAMEVPVVATRSGGMEHFARHGEDAWLVDPGSTDELERGLEALCGDAALRARLARTARARIEREVSFTARMRAVTAIYDSLA
ncbi:MAG: glycosyltransferase [Planctomycetes bacterium]|nr:glycosyltransferase [Planctomycetota bacterium]